MALRRLMKTGSAGSRVRQRIRQRRQLTGLEALTLRSWGFLLVLSSSELYCVTPTRRQMEERYYEKGVEASASPDLLQAGLFSPLTDLLA